MSCRRFCSASATVLPALAGLALFSTLAACDAGSQSEPVDHTPPPATVLPSLFGSPTQSGSGTSTERYKKSDVKRDDLNYYFMANGWGPGFQSQTISWNGTSFIVDSMQGAQGPDYQPASYPTVFCGAYSDSQSGPCGLPKAIADIHSLRTGWSWSANGNDGPYNAAYDVWLSNTAGMDGFSAYLMVWLREPPGAQPAGSRKVRDVGVNNAPGTWDVWVGVVNKHPCISYARTEGTDSSALEMDVMDFIRDARARNIDLPGSTVLGVAVGFEIWSGPISNLSSNDFYVQVQ